MTISPTRTGPYKPFRQQSTSKVRIQVADTLSDVQKARVIEALILKYGSRRALIEELDRRKRLSLLNPDYRINSKGDTGTKDKNPKVPNAPNPQWRELDTPSLLIEGERREDFIPKAVIDIMDFVATDTHEVRRRTGFTHCKQCRCEIDSFTKGCLCCTRRKYARHKALTQRMQKAGVIK